MKLQYYMAGWFLDSHSTKQSSKEFWNPGMQLTNPNDKLEIWRYFTAAPCA